MPSSFLEIIELPNGEVVLQRADEGGEPLVNIRFSEETKAYIADAGLDVAKIMIQAGIQAAAHYSNASSKTGSNTRSITLEEVDEEGVSHTLH